MITGPIKSQVDQIWNAFWSGGISNPMEVIEQITYLLFIRRLDDLQTLKENRANRLKEPIEHPYFPKGKDGLGKGGGRPYAELRWTQFKHLAPAEMYGVVSEHVFPFLRNLGGDDSTYAHHMKDARFTIPTPALLAKVVDLLDKVPLEDRDTKGDVYEYMLGKIASAGQNGQFRTPRHIIQLMVELTAPEAIGRAKVESQGLGLFVRSLVGLDREAAKAVMATFVAGKSGNQIEFVNLVVDHLTEHGIVEPALLYDSPFTDVSPHGPEGLFPPAQVTELIRILDGVRATALAA